jgi:hypothetical protein
MLTAFFVSYLRLKYRLYMVVVVGVLIIINSLVILETQQLEHRLLLKQVLSIVIKISTVDMSRSTNIWINPW